MNRFLKVAGTVAGSWRWLTQIGLFATDPVTIVSSAASQRRPRRIFVPHNTCRHERYHSSRIRELLGDSRLTFRLFIAHLRLHETPNRGVHQTGSRALTVHCSESCPCSI